MDHSQRDSQPQTPLNNLLELRVQAPGPGHSHPAQILHHHDAVPLKQDVYATQPPLESLQGQKNSQLEKVNMDKTYHPTTLPRPTKDHRQPPPIHLSITGCICCEDMGVWGRLKRDSLGHRFPTSQNSRADRITGDNKRIRFEWWSTLMSK